MMSHSKNKGSWGGDLSLPSSGGDSRRRRLSAPKCSVEVIRLLSLRRLGVSEKAENQFDDNDDEDDVATTDHCNRFEEEKRGVSVLSSDLHPLRSSMKVTTLDDSLRRVGSKKSCPAISDGRSPPRSSVSFHTVETREFPRILGDNPAVASGPPVTLGWDHNPLSRSVVSVDNYEQERTPPCDTFQMVVPRFVREGWMADAGYTESEIADAIRRAVRDRSRRNRSRHNAEVAGFRAVDEVMESARRKFRRWTGMESKDTELYDLWIERRGRTLVGQGG